MSMAKSSLRGFLVPMWNRNLIIPTIPPRIKTSKISSKRLRQLLRKWKSKKKSANVVVSETKGGTSRHGNFYLPFFPFAMHLIGGLT